MNNYIRTSQIELCSAFGVQPHCSAPTQKVGISKSALGGELPLNGLRHLETNGTTGWYIWGGTELSDAVDFFLPMHLTHLESECELALKYLLLPPGWRFLTDGDYEDIWFDKALLVK
ncbi:immunity protein Imm33 domain-containing protein [Ruegeria sp.]|uniref:immunity protein Imm33 domain-containing protein n=1 Tax=Ruegeria sp. TaxID=1879320 RepID=UPI003B59B98F